MKTRYRIQVTPHFSKHLKTLDKQTQMRILKQLTLLETDPYAGKALHGEWKGINSLRIGDYRILYTIKKDNIFLLTVDHRKTAYE